MFALNNVPLQLLGMRQHPVFEANRNGAAEAAPFRIELYRFTAFRLIAHSTVKLLSAYFAVNCQLSARTLPANTKVTSCTPAGTSTSAV